ncbi:MAG: glycosyltransferase family 4 protein [Leptospiraceae bacterium]|nr:glycosyltransferase family 4 protein [Leptospiraceae bacterium]
MNIFYDHQIFTEQKYGGISRYFVDLIKEFDSENNLKLIFPKYYSNNENLKEIPNIKIHPYIEFKDFFYNINFKGKSKLFNFLRKLGVFKDAEKLNKLKSLEIIKNERIDLIHPTYYSNYLLDLKFNKNLPMVLTVYDMIHEKYPEYFHDSNKIIEEKKNSILSADKIICISENTKKDLKNIYKIPDNKIEVVHLHSSLNDKYYKNENNKNIFNTEAFLLFVGNRSIYKNFNFMLKSIVNILREDENLYLYCVGGGEFTLEELKFITKLKLLKKIKYFPINSNYKLSSFYSNAKVFIFPSLYEGFGIPLLEAMNYNCTIACSNTSSFPEVAGDCAFYFDPTNHDSILKAIQDALSNQNLISFYKKNMITHINKFSRSKTFNKTKKIYIDLIVK